jgi:hypothetical protein
MIFVFAVPTTFLKKVKLAFSLIKENIWKKNPKINPRTYE